MRSILSASVVALAIALSGCGATIRVPVPPPRPNLPEVPDDLRTHCKHPVTKLGDDLGIRGAEWRHVAVCAEGRQDAAVGALDDLRKGLGGN